MTEPIADVLHQHAHALRGLARALVGDAHADDLVQDAAAAALAQRTPVRQPLAFLRHVVRVQAARWRRGEGRRRRREAAVAAAAEVDVAPPELALARRETIARLHAALMAVPQPQLGALLLRYFEDLPPPAIATRLGVPLGTVKSRLQRGLELLRERLDAADSREHSPDDWRGALVAAFGLHRPAPVAAAAPAVPFALLFVMKTALALFVVAGVVGALLLWPSAAPALPSSTQASTSAVAAAPTALAPAAAAPTLGGATASDMRSVAAAPAGDVAGATTRIVGRIVGDGDGLLPGAEAVLFEQRSGAVVARGATDPDGRFVVDVALGEGRWLELRAIDHVTAGKTVQRAAGGELDVGTTTLLRGVRVRGRVRDRDDRPVAGASVELRTDAPPGPNDCTWVWGPASTDRDGRFALGPLLPRHHALVLATEEVLAPRAVNLASAGTELELDVRVESAERHPRLRGRVVDERGAPIEGASVRAVEPLLAQILFSESAADGTFSLRRPATTPNKPVTLTVSHASHADGVATEVAWGRADVEVVLLPLSDLTVHVRDTAGAAVPSFTLRAFATTLRGATVGHRPVELAAHDAANGSLVVRGLRRGWHDVHVAPVSDALAASGILRLDARTPGAHHTIALQRRATRTLRLAFADGSPAAGVAIELCQALGGATDAAAATFGATDYAVELGEWRNHSVPNKALRLVAATTDTNGEATLTGPAATPLVLRLLGPDCLADVVAVDRLDGDGALAFTVRRGGAIRVVATPTSTLAAIAALRTQEHHPAPCVWVARPIARGSERVPPGAAEAPRFDAHGIALLRGVPPGPCTPHVEFANECLVLPVVEVRDGETTEVTLDLTPWRPVTLRGRVLVDGAPARAAMVEVQRLRGPGERLAGRWVAIGGRPVGLDGDGRFELRTLPGAVRLLQRSPHPDDGGRNPSLAEPVSVDLAAGEAREVEFRITLGTALARFVDAQQRPVPGVHAWLARPDDYMVARLPASGADGRAQLDGAETTPLRLFVLPRRFGDPRTAIPELYARHPDDEQILDRTRLDLGPIVVRAGEPVEQTFVLPDAWYR